MFTLIILFQNFEMMTILTGSLFFLEVVKNVGIYDASTDALTHIKPQIM